MQKQLFNFTFFLRRNCLRTGISANKADPLSGKKTLKCCTTSSRFSWITAMGILTKFDGFSTNILEIVSWSSPKRSLRSFTMVFRTSIPMTILKYSRASPRIFARRVCHPHLLGGITSVSTIFPQVNTLGQIFSFHSSSMLLMELCKVLTNKNDIYFFDKKTK